MTFSYPQDSDEAIEHAAYVAGLIDEDDALNAPDPEYRELDPGMLHEVALDDLDDVAVQGRMLIAAQYRIMSDALRQAAQTPEPWVGVDPTLSPDWTDSRRRTAAAVKRERREIAVRAAAADIAVRLRMSEVTVRMQASYADTLRDRCPRLWQEFLNGRVHEQNAVTAAKLVASLPHDDADCWVAFDDQVTDAAMRLTPVKFRVRARSVRERVHAESLDDRHRRAAADRTVWVTPELDGMAVFSALMPATDAHAGKARLDAIAQHLRDQPDETRTLAQLRADAFSDILTAGDTDTTAGIGGASVAITVPVMTLLGSGSGSGGGDADGSLDRGAGDDGGSFDRGAGDDGGSFDRGAGDDGGSFDRGAGDGAGFDPALLEGYGPIDLATAKRLAGTATSWIRILTHPITGTVLDVDRTTYRVPKALRRWLGVTHPVCIFPGCNRPSRDCDIDHLLDWQHGGPTAADNLGPECEHHHVIKHGSLWSVAKDPGNGIITWTSPTGHTSDPDPPPF